MEIEVSDKDKQIAGLIVGAIKAGYKITFERKDIGAVKPEHSEIHLAYVDELYPELSDFNVFDYINQELTK